MDEILKHALKLLAGRDYSTARLRQKLETRFGDVPEAVFDHLRSKKFLNDRRFAENYIAGHKDRAAGRLRLELAERGIPADILDDVLAKPDSSSLRRVAAAKMVDWRMRPPLSSGEAARLFRALARLGYDEDAIREEIEQLHER